AEIGSSYLCGLCGIESSVLDNQASYIASWLKGLNGDPMLIVNASVAAQKAVNYILGNSQSVNDSIDQ
ncbi:MAG: zincin-like metallopeptidase domain-containing protein, partial [Ignavibacteriaceae bacterium]